MKSVNFILMLLKNLRHSLWLKRGRNSFNADFGSVMFMFYVVMLMCSCLLKVLNWLMCLFTVFVLSYDIVV